MNTEAANALTNETDAHQAAQSAPQNVVPPPLPPECHTPHDSVVRACAPPVIESMTDCENLIRESTDTLASGSLEQLQIVPGRRGKQESASWLSSIAVHAVLIAIIGFILAPADFGGADAMNLIITFSDQEAAEQVEVKPLIEVAVSHDVTAPKDTTDAQPLIEPMPVAAISGATPSKSVERSNGNATSGNASPRGSFFGIEAHGHEFVYVLDMSGSMEGRRFRRATAELERSVSGLRESQNFYVLLFDDTAVQMFNGRGIRPKSVPATSENKEKLSEWLKTAFRGGGTDPRDALRIALRMNPSAIFMLSDGKFNGKKNQSSSLVRGNSDAFSIVEAAAASVPIHAIAFENVTSCENMKRLAEMTNGAYRFCKAQDESSAKDALTRARAVRNLGDISYARELLRDVVFNFGDTQTAWNARRELCEMLADVVEDGLETGQLTVAKQAFLEIVSIDALAVTTADLQQELLEKLMKRSNQGSESDAEKAFAILTEVVQRYPKSKVTLLIIGPVADRIMNEALQLGTNDHPVQAVQKMEEVLTKYPQTPAADRCRLEQKQVVEDLLAHARKLRQTDNDAASAKYLNELVAEFQGTGVNAVAAKALEELATEMLTKARDGTVGRDRAAKDDAERQLSEGFGGNAILQRVQRDFARDERNARDLLRQGIRLENIDELDRASVLYKRIVTEYPSTLAAKKAEANLRAIQREQKKDSLVDVVDLELLKMMQP